jgi:hypothetical protein
VSSQAHTDFQGQLGIDTNATVTLRQDYVHEDVKVQEEFKDTNGLRGTREHDITRVRAGNRRIGGPITMEPTAVEWAALLPWILGGTPSGTTYPLADSAPTGRYVVVDRGAKVFSYNGCQVDRATIRGSEGNALEVTLDVVGIDESVGNSGTFPSLSLDTTTGPFMFTDSSGAVSINSATTNIKNIEIVIDNQIDKGRFYNSQTLVTVQPMDRHITVAFDVPYGDSSALYNTGAGGVAVTATFTNGTVSIAFSFVKVTFPRESPTYVNGRGEVMLRLRGKAYKSSSTLSLVTTLDSTP